MDLNTVRLILEPFVALFLYIVSSGVGISLITQALKDRRVPIPASTHPRVVAAVGAVISTFISLYVGSINLLLTTAWHYVGLAIVILLASSFAYRVLVDGLVVPGTDPTKK